MPKKINITKFLAAVGPAFDSIADLGALKRAERCIQVGDIIFNDDGNIELRVIES